MIKIFLFILLTALPMVTHAAPYKIDHNQSIIAFTGTHAENEFNGTFTGWTATIEFDDDDLNQSTAIITINTDSAKTGNPMYDGTLPTTDWFDVETHTTITFTSKKFEKSLLGFTVTGDLKIKDKIREISFDFSLDDLSPRTVKAEFPINRLSYDIGKKSDPSAEWVGENINVQIKLVTK